jgi:hypothetical protein
LESLFRRGPFEAAWRDFFSTIREIRVGIDIFVRLEFRGKD